MRSPTVRMVRAILAVAASVWICYASCTFMPLHTGESLYLATCARDYQGMQHWLGRYADPDFKFDGGKSSLECALDMDDPRSVAILLNHGSDVEKLTNHYLALLNRPNFSKKVEEERLQPGNR